MKALLARSAERMLALIIGAFLIYLGYRLFVDVPKITEQSSGNIILPGFEVTLTYVGPGVFFALFGAVVLWLSIRTQLQFSSQDTPVSSVPSDETPRTVVFTYLAATEGVSDTEAIKSARSRLLRDFRAIDRLCAALAKMNADDSSAIPEESRADFMIATPRIKEGLMLTVWHSDWGDYAAFSAWVRKGCSDPPPKGLEAPAQLYLGEG